MVEEQLQDAYSRVDDGYRLATRLDVSQKCKVLDDFCVTYNKSYMLSLINKVTINQLDRIASKMIMSKLA